MERIYKKGVWVRLSKVEIYLFGKGEGKKNIMVTSCKMHVKEIGQSSIINIPTPNADYEEGDSCIYVILNMFQIWKYETKYDLTYLQPLIF